MFQDEHTVALKKTMLLRIPACKYNEEDIANLIEKYLLTRAQIMEWVYNLQNRISPEKVLSFLSEEKEAVMV